MFDHGLLNLPLSARGDIDAEIDRFKANKVAATKRANRELRATVKAALLRCEEGMVAKYGPKLGATKVRAHIRSAARFDPVRFLKHVAIYDKETS